MLQCDGNTVGTATHPHRTAAANARTENLHVAVKAYLTIMASAVLGTLRSGYAASTNIASKCERCQMRRTEWHG
jgi:hypothetical protein